MRRGYVDTETNLAAAIRYIRAGYGSIFSIVTLTGEIVCIDCEVAAWGPCKRHQPRTSGARGLMQTLDRRR